MSGLLEDELGLLTKAQAVEALGGQPITERTLDTLVSAKQIGYLKVGRAVVFPVRKVHECIEAHTVEPVENPWGLTESALRHVRSSRAGRAGRAS